MPRAAAKIDHQLRIGRMDSAHQIDERSSFMANSRYVTGSQTVMDSPG